MEAAKGLKTESELAQEYAIHPNQISTWKQQLLSQGRQVLRRTETGATPQEVAEAALYEQIGRLKVELEWLKKKAAEFE